MKAALVKREWPVQVSVAVEVAVEAAAKAAVIAKVQAEVVLHRVSFHLTAIY